MTVSYIKKKGVKKDKGFIQHNLSLVNFPPSEYFVEAPQVIEKELLKRSEYLSKLEERCKKEGVKAKKNSLKRGRQEYYSKGICPVLVVKEKIICLKNSRCRLYIPNCQAFQPFLQPFSSSLHCILLAFLLSFHLM